VVVVVVVRSQPDGIDRLNGPILKREEEGGGFDGITQRRR